MTRRRSGLPPWDPSHGIDFYEHFGVRRPLPREQRPDWYEFIQSSAPSTNGAAPTTQGQSSAVPKAPAPHLHTSVPTTYKSSVAGAETTDTDPIATAGVAGSGDR